jgi:hypothetical protein
VDAREFQAARVVPSVLVPAERRVGFGLFVEYLMFASGIFLALMLFATRVPLRIIDTTFGLRLRERFIDFLAWLSPG